MDNLIKKLVPFGASPAIIMALRFLSIFQLQPLAIWEFPDWSVAFPAVFAGAGLASLIPRSNTSLKTKGIWIGLSLASFLLLLVAYDIVSGQPPYAWWGWQLLWELGCFLFYVGSYFAVGYCLAFVTRVLIERGWVDRSVKEKGEKG
jgi:peptidoglycan/LPS O-acetylase OafA/YrhL